MSDDNSGPIVPAAVLRAARAAKADGDDAGLLKLAAALDKAGDSHRADYFRAVVARDRAQPEATLSLDQYAARRTSPRAVATGRLELRRHTAVLDRVEASYGVPPAIVIAVWGLESTFGRFTGTYPTIRALATLAYDGRRPLFAAHVLPRRRGLAARSEAHVCVPVACIAQHRRLALPQRRPRPDLEALRSRRQGECDHDVGQRASGGPGARVLRVALRTGVRHRGQRALVAGVSAAR